MSICITCGVELEDNMEHCPLCGTPAGASPRRGPQEEGRIRGDALTRTETSSPGDKSLLQRILWQVTSILLLSGILSTLIIDLAAHKMMTWSVYPVTVCIIIFVYSTLFAFWYARKIYQIITGLLISSVFFIILDALLSQSDWPLKLGLPLLCAVNLVAIILIAVVNRAKLRGLNVIAFMCVAIAVLSMSVEAVLSVYQDGKIVLRWSVIVSACMLPVTTALLFMHYRIKKNPEMEKIFHT